MPRTAGWQVLPVGRLDDLGGQNGLEPPDISVVQPEVAEHILTSPHHFQLLAHRNISLKAFRRSLTSPMSRAGVLMPFFDFLWNA